MLCAYRCFVPSYFVSCHFILPTQSSDYTPILLLKVYRPRLDPKAARAAGLMSEGEMDWEATDPRLEVAVKVRSCWVEVLTLVLFIVDKGMMS